MHSVAIIALAALAVANPMPASWSGQPIPDCGWTTTLIYEADHTDTVPIPLASADCSMTSMASVPPPAPVSMSTPAPPAPPSSMPSPPPAPSSMMMQCTEYQDGQPQCSMVPVAPCTVISDGQPQCPTSVPVIPPPMPTGVMPTGGYGTGYPMPTGTGVYPGAPASSIQPAIGAAPTNGPVLGLLAAAGFAVALM